MKEEQIALNIDFEISILKKIDVYISEITGIDILVQMVNSKIDNYSKLICHKLSNEFEEDYIKFYLFTKRNYFIKELLEFGIKPSLLFENKLNHVEAVNYYNSTYTDYIINYYKNINYDDLKINFSDPKIVKSAILEKLFLNLTSEIEIFGDGRGLNRKIFNQNSFLIGLKFDTYIKLNQLIHKKCNYDFDGVSHENNLEIFKSLLYDKVPSKSDILDIYVQDVIEEIKLVCLNTKFNQDNIGLKI